jgi:peptide chain release factor subunit 1
MPNHDASVLILTPMKSARRHLGSYFAALETLTYPHGLLSLGILEGDSTDGTFDEVGHCFAQHCSDFRRKTLFKRDFGFLMPEGVPRYADAYQAARRSILARARNHLLFRALRDEQWVLWLDVDVVEYPSDILEQLLSFDKDILHPNCVIDYGGESFDRNAWSAGGQKHLSDMRDQTIVRLEAVGGTMLLVRADRHRDGLVFPSFFYGARSRWVRDPHPLRGHHVGEIETEGLALMAKDMGIECWGLPRLEIRHCPE